VVLQLAFWILGAGIVCGAVWADASWGRPWNWDPKAPGGIPSNKWTALPAAATTPPTSQYQQWFPWTEGEESW